MKIDIGQDQTAGAAQRRADLITGLSDLTAFLVSHPDSPLPVVGANWRIPAGPRGERIAALDEIAEMLGVGVTADDMGNLFAAREFGPVRAEGHLSPEDRSMSAYRAAAEHRNSVGANGATA